MRFITCLLLFHQLLAVSLADDHCSRDGEQDCETAEETEEEDIEAQTVDRLIDVVHAFLFNHEFESVAISQDALTALRDTFEHGNELIELQKERTEVDPIHDQPKVDTKALTEWCHREMNMSKSLEIREAKGMGLGIFASRQIRLDESLFTTPLNRTFSQAIHTKYLRECFGNVSDGMDLTLELIKYRINPNNSHDKFQIYFNALPRTFIQTMYFTPGDFELLRPSHVFKTTILYYVYELNAYCMLWVKLRSNETCSALYGVDPDLITLDVFKWGVSNTIARRFAASGDENDDTLSVIYPCWDFANHGPGGGDIFTQVVYESANDTDAELEGTAKRPLKANTQIFNHYTEDMDSFKAFFGYGFAQPYTYHIRLQLPNGTVIEKIGGKDILLRKPDGGNQGLLPAKQVAVLHEIVNGAGNTVMTRHSMSNLWGYLAQQMRRTRSKYPHTLLEYKQLYEGTKESLPGTTRLVYEQLISELQMLDELLEACLDLQNN